MCICDCKSFCLTCWFLKPPRQDQTWSILSTQVTPWVPVRHSLTVLWPTLTVKDLEDTSRWRRNLQFLLQPGHLWASVSHFLPQFSHFSWIGCNKHLMDIKFLSEVEQHKNARCCYCLVTRNQGIKLQTPELPCRISLPFHNTLPQPWRV